MGRKTTTHWDVYNTQLACLNHGRALWEADPKANGEDVRVEVGDVGYIRNGGFHRLFNILLPADDPSHRSLGVPENFSPLKPVGKVTQSRNPIEKRALHSHSVRNISGTAGVSAGDTAGGSGELSFSCTKERGAALILFDKAFRKDVLSTELFEDFFLDNYESWAAFASRLKRGVSLSDIILVTGRDVTTRWAMVAFTRSEGNASVGVGAGIPGVTATFGMSYGWRTQGIVHSHHGPQPVDPPSPGRGKVVLHDPQTNATYDQCVFVRGYSMRAAVPRPFKLKAAAGPDDLGSGDRSPDNVPELFTLSGESPANTCDLNPLSPVLDYILKNSSAKIAIAHDDDLHPYVKDSSDPDEVQKAIEAVAPRIILSEGRVGKIDRTHLVSSSSDDAEPRNATAGTSLHPPAYEDRKNVIKIKIRSVARMMRVLSVLREESEKVSELKSRSDDGKLPPGILVLGSESIRDVSLEFIGRSQPASPVETSRDSWFASMSPETSDTGGTISLTAALERHTHISHTSSRSQGPPPYAASSPGDNTLAVPVPMPAGGGNPLDLPGSLQMNPAIETSRSSAADVTEGDSQDAAGAPPQITATGRWKSVRTKMAALAQFKRALNRRREPELIKQR